MFRAQRNSLVAKHVEIIRAGMKLPSVVVIRFYKALSLMIVLSFSHCFGVHTTNFR